MCKDTSEIKVSVYCLAYNHEKYIRRALDGFVMQKTNFKFEVIVHDDASTDDTADIIREYERKYPDIIKPIYQNENQYSKGISVVRTYIHPRLHRKYVAICEGDDYWTDENKLQMQYDIMENNTDYAACVHQSYQYNVKTGEKSKVSYLKESREITIKDVAGGSANVYQTSSLFYRRKYLENLPEFYVNSKIGDYPLAIVLAANGGIYYINKPMSCYNYMSSADSWTGRNNTQLHIKRLNESILMLKSADEYYEYKYHKYFESAIRLKEYKIQKNLSAKDLWKNTRYFKYYYKDLMKKIMPKTIYNSLKQIIKK